ncbi:hypothetical protein B0H12DRAFT_525306 [Mycena haematopus]|nr:hypothetical protein B0H12DRAFT_525306 [Mycena haematopus]
MALQTEVHTTSSSSSSAQSASPVPTTTGSDPTDTGFSLSASPPLIIAFLAVGLFAISMVVFFGWRRMNAGRTTWAVTADNALIGETPKLWDVWSPRERPPKALTAEWRHIQPLAATVLAAAALAHLRRRYRRPTSQAGVILDEKLNRDELLVRLQIAVTIDMPCPDIVRDSSRTEPDDGSPLEYSIGLYEIPWKKTH